MLVPSPLGDRDAKDTRSEADLHMEDARGTMQIPTSIDEIHHVQTAVQREMERLGYDTDTCFAVKLAIEESLINAMKHGNKFDPRRSVTVHYEVDERRVRISVKDQGKGFDPSGVPDPTADENLAKPNGRGIMLMRAYMDEVTYSECGTEVIMVKVKK